MFVLNQKMLCSISRGVDFPSRATVSRPTTVIVFPDLLPLIWLLHTGADTGSQHRQENGARQTHYPDGCRLWDLEYWCFRSLWSL